MKLFYFRTGVVVGCVIFFPHIFNTMENVQPNPNTGTRIELLQEISNGWSSSNLYCIVINEKGYLFIGNSNYMTQIFKRTPGVDSLEPETCK